TPASGRLNAVIDIKHLAENPELYRASQRAREDDESLVDQIIAVDSERRAALQAFENLRAEQNALSKKIGPASGEEKQALLAQAKELSANVKAAQAQADAKDQQLDELNNIFPNLIIEGIPSGDEDNFAVLKEVGQLPDFDFAPRDHLELGEMLGAIDIERGAKVSGSRFYFLKGVGAQLEMALTHMGMDQAIEAGCTPSITPTLVRPEVRNGTGFNVEHDDEIYRIEKDDLYLVGTSEVALAGYYADEILDLNEGPIRFAGYSTCYRREAGAAGKDTRGIIRVHQFNKLEMFIYTTVEEAAAANQLALARKYARLPRTKIPYTFIETDAYDLYQSPPRINDREALLRTKNAKRQLP